MWMLRNRSKSSSSLEVDFFDLCKHKVRRIEDLVNGGNLLNQRQCQDLSFKLSETTLNIGELVLHCGASAVLLRPALENLYRYLEKAKVLVSKCGEENWCAAAVFQSQNENAFIEILLDVGLCYNAIYEQAKSTGQEWNVHLEDLRSSSMFQPATDSDIHKDQQDLQKRLEDVANELSRVKLLDHFLPRRGALKQCLARYLLVKMNHTSEQSQANTLDRSSEILWAKETEPSGTWGIYNRFLGAGASGVCSTKWMDIPCAKKEFHPQEAERIFLEEAGILTHLKHPCIVNFICCGNGQERGDRFIAMELMEKSLSNLIEDQKDVYFSIPIVIDIIIQIARGVCYLHEQGVAHRDLKPQNVVVNRLKSQHLVDHFCVKLVDFGMAKTKVQVSMSNTISICGVGTTMYRAPEVHPKAHPSGKGKAIWFNADVYSFAMTCSHVLSLKIPFEDMEHVSELYKEIKNGRRPKLPENCPQELIELLEDCWNINPRFRPSFKEIYLRLERFRHNILRGISTVHQGWQEKKVDFNMGFDFIKMKLAEHSSIQRPLVKENNDEEEIEMNDLHEYNKNDVVPVIPCTCGRTLKLLLQSPHKSGFLTCNMCREEVIGKVYHCETCQFDIHPECAEIKDKVKVFFHDDSLHLLVQNYYINDSDVICGFCEESVQVSEWVYKCEQCNFHAHALCTKYCKKMKHLLHHHSIMVQSPSQKRSFCKRCTGNLKGYRYACIQNSCTQKFEMHPRCAIATINPLCIFDRLHRLSLISQRDFLCGKCGVLGFSYSYHCNHCDVDIHPYCVDDMEEGDNWIEAYENFMVKYGSTKDDKTKVDMISELLSNLSISDNLKASLSSSSRPPRVTMKMQSTIQRISLMERLDLETFDEHQAKMLATKEAKQNLKGKLLELLENLEKIVMGLQSSKMSQVDVEVLASTIKKLKKRQHIVQEEQTNLVQSKIRRGPRISLFFQRRINTGPNILLTNVQADMEGVGLDLLCEEPGHEHIVPNVQGFVSGYVLGAERAKKIEPLLAFGLQIVTKAIMAAQLTQLDFVTLPNLGMKSWDLRDIELQKHNKYIMKPFQDEGNVEVLKKAENSAAEWLLSHLEDNGRDILKLFGLLRIRYKVTEEGNFPRYRHGTMAWLCTDHQKRGLEAGTLESYPLRMYHNFKYDQQRRFL